MHPNKCSIQINKLHNNMSIKRITHTCSKASPFRDCENLEKIIFLSYYKIALEKFSSQHCKDYNAFRKLLHFRETVWDRELEKRDIKGSVNSLTYSCAQYVSSLYEHFRVKSVRVFRDWIHMSIRLLNKITICNRMFYNKNKQLI